MKKAIFTAAIVLVTLFTSAQVTRDENGHFHAAKKEQPTLTQWNYFDSEGKEYQVWKSESGKLFIYRVSKKSGKTYRYYIEAHNIAREEPLD